MDADKTMSLMYLVILGVAVGGWFLAQNRQKAGKTLQQAAVWVLIFVGVIAGVGLWGDIKRTVLPQQSVATAEGRIEIPRSPDGHYYLVAKINDNAVRFVVDTGATDIVLTHADAAASGIDTKDLAYIGRASTANGMVRTAPIRIADFSIGPVLDTNLQGWVNEGDMGQSLLGMSYLQRYSTIQIAEGKMVLIR